MYILKDKKISVLGGDTRQLYAARELLKNNYTVSLLALPSEDMHTFCCNSVEEALSEACAVILPLPLTTDGIRLFCPLAKNDIKLDHIIEHISNGQLIAGGKMPAGFVEKIREKNAIPFDYYNSERFSILNAIPTAEGAVSIAINETKTTLFGSKCAVLGYGRIGRILSKTLKALGAEVTVFARKEAALAYSEAEGYEGINIRFLAEHLQNKKIIFNTIPNMVLTKSVLDFTDKDVTIIDLASAPGGVDGIYAKEIKRKVIYALSLPGKVAPETAGKIISDTILSNIRGDNI